MDHEMSDNYENALDKIYYRTAFSLLSKAGLVYHASAAREKDRYFYRQMSGQIFKNLTELS